MSKSTYKQSMLRLRERPKKQHMADDVKHTPFIPSKDNPIEVVAAVFGSPKTFEVTRKNFRNHKPGRK